MAISVPKPIASILFTKDLVCYTKAMTQEEEIAQLKKELSRVLERVSEMVEQLSKAGERESEYQKQLSAMRAENHALNEQLVRANMRIEELEKLKTPPAAFVKANKKALPEEQKKARKKRDAKHNRGRPRSTPTRDSWSIGLSVARTVICV